MENEEIISVKAILGCECKRFGIPVTSTFSNLTSTLCRIFACDVSEIQYHDGDNDLVSMSSQEEFSIALKSVPKTNGILRLVIEANLHSTLNTQISIEVPIEVMEVTETNENDASIEDANRRSIEMLTAMEYLKKPVQTSVNDDKEANPTSSSPRKTSIRHKIESASQLSKNLNFNSSEVTGRIPVLAQSSVCNLDSHFTTQKPVGRKVRRVSSGTTSGGTDKNDKKQNRGRQSQRKKKRKHRDSSTSSSSSSQSRSSSTSSSSTSGSSCDDYRYYKKTGKKKRKSSPSPNIEKMLHKCEKRIVSKVCKDLDKYTKKFKEDITSSVTSSILQRLDGAVLQSITVPNGSTAQTNEAGPSCSKPSEGVTNRRMRYQHQNVVCDHCENEIFGPRYKCGNCSDYDLCEKCEAIEGLHTPSHVFVKMHFPAVHAGRRSVGGKSRPLLRANIYEEREKEREMEDLLQRKLDSGSELNQKVLEKIEKRRSKDEQAKEAYDNRKEEWKKMKKEIKKNKKELKKKLKQQGKIMQRNITRSVNNNKEEIFLTKEGFCFDVESLPKVENKVAKEPNFMEEPAKNKTPDENLSSALSSLQIVQSEPVIYEAETNDSSININNENIIDLTMDSDDVIVVNRGDAPSLDLEISAAGSVVETLRKPDLVDFTRETDSVTSEEFVVVSNYFDLSVPIDDHHVLEHRNCESCHSCRNVSTPDFIQPHATCSATTNQLPMDLVASVPETARNQPDIASTVNIMDQSIESFSSVASSPPISPEPVNSSQSDAPLTDVHVTHPRDTPSPTPTITPGTPTTTTQPATASVDLTSQPTPISNERNEIQPVLLEPESSENIVCVPSSAMPCPPLPVVQDDRRPDCIDQQPSPVAVASPVTTQQPCVDVNNPIIQAQIEREESIRNDYLRQVSLNTFESARSAVPDLPRDSSVQPEVTSNSDNAVATNNNIGGGGFSGALVGAMASIVDTVAHVVQSAKGSPKAEYHNGEVEVTIPVEPKVEGMQQLLDMGFFDRPLNERLLVKHNNDVGLCVADLIAENNNEWHQTRH